MPDTQQSKPKTGQPNRVKQPQTHYDLLGLKPNASVQQIRRAYRDLSKLYHPDTTELSDAIATQKFQTLNEAYATLSNPDQRTIYDLKIGYSRFHVMQAPADMEQSNGPNQSFQSKHLYLDPTDRPLSAGEVFALFILGLTFAACLTLVVIMGFTKGELNITPFTAVPADMDFSISNRISPTDRDSSETNLADQEPPKATPPSSNDPSSASQEAQKPPYLFAPNLTHGASKSQYPTL